jgi:hypothetical protein
MASTQEHLTPSEQEQLEELLCKYKSLMDGTLGQWIGDPYDIQLKPGSMPYHAKAFPVPCMHLETFKTKIEHLVRLEYSRRLITLNGQHLVI